MLEYTVPDLSCGHCARAVTEAVQAIDPQAKVEVDLSTRQVRVDSSLARPQVQAALTEAGYPPSGT